MNRRPPPPPVPELDPDELRLSLRERLEFIELRLYWEGRINRGDITARFGVTLQAATADLNRYQALAPAAIEYDRNAKAYYAAAGFEPRLIRPDAQAWLMQLQALGSGLIAPAQGWLGWQPEWATHAQPQRSVPALTLRRVLGAIREQRALHACYQSMSRPEPHWRWLSPHALAHDGWRWHARAYCHEHGDYRDFVLARFLDLEAPQVDAQGSASEDLDWQTRVTLRIAANPALSEAQRRIIELDYGMTGGSAEIICRRSMLYYTRRQLGLVDGDGASAAQRQLVLLDAAEEAPGTS